MKKTILLLALTLATSVTYAKNNIVSTSIETNNLIDEFQSEIEWKKVSVSMNEMFSSVHDPDWLRSYGINPNDISSIKNNLSINKTCLTSFVDVKQALDEAKEQLNHAANGLMDSASDAGQYYQTAKEKVGVAANIANGMNVQLCDRQSYDFAGLGSLVARVNKLHDNM